MDLYEAMTTTPATREFTDEDVPDGTLYRVFDKARFASNGGNRQGWRVIVVRDPATKTRLWELYQPGAEAYRKEQLAKAQAAGNERAIEQYSRTDTFSGQQLDRAPVFLLVLVDVNAMAITDKDLDRPSIIGGGSVYTFVQNVMLGLRAEGYGTVLTTLICPEEPAVKELLGIPEEFAIAGLLPVGRPAKSVTKLKRRPVETFVTRERYSGEPFTAE